MAGKKKKNPKQRCEVCGRALKQQFIGLKHCKCGMSWQKGVGFFERSPDMVFALERQVVKKSKSSIKTKQTPVIRYKNSPEPSGHEINAADSVHRQERERHGDNSVIAIPELVVYSELDKDLKMNIYYRMGELIAEFIGNMSYIPEKDDMNDIFSDVAEEFSEEINYREPEPFNPAEHYGGLDYDFIREQLKAGATLGEIFSDDDEDDFDEDYEEHTEPPKRELVPDDAMIAAFNELLDKIVKEFREDGFDPPTFLDTLRIVETDRLIIRKFAKRDLNALNAIMQKPEVMYAWEHGFKRKEARKWLNQQRSRYRKDGYGYFAVILKDTGKIIGQAGLMKADINGKSVVELGIIFDNTVWGKGYSDEAAKACIDMAFGKLKLNKLYCTIRPENEPSIRLAERLGMVKTGEFIKVYEGKEMPHFIYVLVKENSDGGQQ